MFFHPIHSMNIIIASADAKKCLFVVFYWQIPQRHQCHSQSYKAKKNSGIMSLIPIEFQRDVIRASRDFNNSIRSIYRCIRIRFVLNICKRNSANSARDYLKYRIIKRQNPCVDNIGCRECPRLSCRLPCRDIIRSRIPSAKRFPFIRIILRRVP